MTHSRFRASPQILTRANKRKLRGKVYLQNKTFIQLVLTECLLRLIDLFFCTEKNSSK